MPLESKRSARSRACAMLGLALMLVLGPVSQSPGVPLDREYNRGSAFDQDVPVASLVGLGIVIVSLALPVPEEAPEVSIQGTGMIEMMIAERQPYRIRLSQHLQLPLGSSERAGKRTRTLYGPFVGFAEGSLSVGAAGSQDVQVPISSVEKVQLLEPVAKRQKAKRRQNGLMGVGLGLVFLGKSNIYSSAASTEETVVFWLGVGPLVVGLCELFFPSEPEREMKRLTSRSLQSAALGGSAEDVNDSETPRSGI